MRCKRSSECIFLHFSKWSESTWCGYLELIDYDALVELSKEGHLGMKGSNIFNVICELLLLTVELFNEAEEINMCRYVGLTALDLRTHR